MSKKNLIVYGACNELGFHIWQCLTPHNRVFMKDPLFPNSIPGVYNIEQELYKHPSIQKTYYKPVEGIIITRDDEYNDQLMDEISLVDKGIQILVINDYECYERLKKTGLNLTFIDAGTIIKVEDLYFKDTMYVECEDSYWENIFRYSLFNLTMKKYDKKTTSEVSKELQ
tara:strand:- start:61 stop:570 length:510 start_codon:yes stop_codon:yes gene_type:complete